MAPLAGEPAVANGFNAAAASAGVANRSPGCFARKRSITCWKPEGRFSTIAESGSGFSVACFTICVMMFVSGNGGRPARQ